MKVVTEDGMRDVTKGVFGLGPSHRIKQHFDRYGVGKPGSATLSSDVGIWMPYMVSSRFARPRVQNDRDRIAAVYPAC